MKDNNRAKNRNCIRYALNTYPVDRIIVDAQGFDFSDFEEGIEYIGKHSTGIGFVAARNELLSYFYESDYDWAIWLDANAKISKTCMNDFLTILNAIRNDLLKIDCIFSTLGLQVSQDRIIAKSAADHFDVVRLVNVKGGYDWCHGMFFRNFRKYYGISPMISEACDPRKGTSEDVFFARLCKKIFDCRLCPTMTIAKPSNAYSTWVASERSYNYAPVAVHHVDRMVQNYCRHASFTPLDRSRGTITINRVKGYESFLTAYKPRYKQERGLLK